MRRDGKKKSHMQGINIHGGLLTMISLFADKVMSFVYLYLGIIAVKRARAKHQKVSGIKPNCDKFAGL